MSRGWGKTPEHAKAALERLRAKAAGRHHAEPLAERRRIANYQRANGSERITPAQRRRWMKKAMSNGQWDKAEEWYMTMVRRAEGHWPDYTIEFKTVEETPELVEAAAWTAAGGPGAVTRERPQRSEGEATRVALADEGSAWIDYEVPDELVRRLNK